MTARAMVIFLAIAAIAIFLPRKEGSAGQIGLRCIDPGGRDRLCPRRFAYVEPPPREKTELISPVHDFAYAAAAAGPEGCAWLLSGLALIVFVLGLWARGFRGALRRFLLTLALGVPLSLALLYASCFLPGRTIRLGPEAQNYAIAGLHVQTDRTSGLLSPKDVVLWHAARGFSVLNVSDRNTIEPALEAVAFAQRAAIVPPLLVTVGEEWHGSPDVLLVNVKRSWPTKPRLTVAALSAGVRAEGGATFVAHPWDKIPPDRSLDELLDDGLDGMEIVNGVIYGGRGRVELARSRKKALLGVLDYKFGPHVNAVTLIDAEFARSPQGVVQALRQGDTHVLYAVPGGTMSGEEWKAAELGITGAAAGFRSLLESGRLRRVTWYFWLVVATILWWITSRDRPQGTGKPASVRVARFIFIGCGFAMMMVPLGVSWQVRESIGTIPIFLLLITAVVLAVPLLATCHVLDRAERSSE